MIEIKNKIIYQTDKEVLQLILDLKKQGFKIPNFPNDKTSFIPIVYYRKSFELYFVGYLSKPGDSGYVAFLIKNFLTENNFNLRELSKISGCDESELASNILIQIRSICKQINYPFTVSLVIKPCGMGFLATPNHPLDEIMNTNGRNN